MTRRGRRKPAAYAKALVGAALAGLGALGTALADERVTSAEWVVVAIAVLSVGGGVAKTENR